MTSWLHKKARFHFHTQCLTVLFVQSSVTTFDHIIRDKSLIFGSITYESFHDLHWHEIQSLLCLLYVNIVILSVHALS